MRALDAAAAASGAAAMLARVRPRAATSVLAGAVPDPLLSSSVRGWSGLTVELHGFDDLDTVVHAPDHVIAVHLAGNVVVHQARAGRVRSRAMRAGDVTITPVGSPVHWRQVGHSLVILLRLATAHLRTIAGDECAIDPDRFEIQPAFSTRDPVIEDFARRLLAALELEGVDGRLYVDTLACELAIHLLRRHTRTPASPSWSKARLSPHKLRRMVQYVDDNLANELSLAAMAEAVALSPGHFAHAFRAAIGVAPHRYVVERRIERAKELLRESDLPITEIAQRIGCSSHSHFSVQFHRVTGLTPRQYRNRE